IWPFLAILSSGSSMPAPTPEARRPCLKTTMESLEHMSNPGEKRESAQKDESAGSKAALCVRLCEYPGPQEKLRDLDCAADDAIAALIRNVFSESQGKLSEVRGSTLVAQFENSFSALSAAKTLQVKLLTFHRTPPANQIVAAVMIDGDTQLASRTEERRVGKEST